MQKSHLVHTYNSLKAMKNEIYSKTNPRNNLKYIESKYTTTNRAF